MKKNNCYICKTEILSNEDYSIVSEYCNLIGINKTATEEQKIKVKELIKFDKGNKIFKRYIHSNKPCLIQYQFYKRIDNKPIQDIKTGYWYESYSHQNKLIKGVSNEN